MELLVERGVDRWNSRRQIYQPFDYEMIAEKKRQRAFNPAYVPRYTEEDLRRASEVFPDFKNWDHYCGHHELPIRDLKAFTFLPNLESLQLTNTEVADVSPLAGMARLRVLHFNSSRCDDLSPIARCVGLRDLALRIGVGLSHPSTRWPSVTGLEKLEQLEKLALQGNLLVFGPGFVWPKVRQATLRSDPLPLRTVGELPQLPACEFLLLAGVERLDGIEALPKLRNLTVETNVRDFAPLTALKRLTCFTCGGVEPLNLEPLARLPKLQCARFNAQYQFALHVVRPRDFAPLTEATALRELIVANCPPVEAEVNTLNSLLPSWDDVLLVERPRPLSPVLRMIVAPPQKHPQRNDIPLDPEDDGLPDEGLRECEGRWVGRWVERAISRKLGAADWGTASGNGRQRSFFVTIESFGVVEKLPLIVEAMRECLARLRSEYLASFMIALKAPRLEPTPAQIELKKQFQEEQDEAEYERNRRDRQALLDRMHRLELKRQLGDKINPDEFVPPAATPLPPPPWQRDNDDEDEDDATGDGDVAVKEKTEPDPPPSWLDDEHPLADNYRMLCGVSLTELWVTSHHRDAAVYLMGRQPDLEIPEENKPE